MQAELGHIFVDTALLAQALTHRSFGASHNERLEFLGDSILNCAIAKLIFERHPAKPEGELSRLRANLVNQNVLAEIASKLGIGALLRLGEGEIKTGGATRPSILADAVEALLGAAFLDAGFEAAFAMVERLFADRLIVADSNTTASKDAKTMLQEWLQARRLPLPVYVVAKISGEAHQQIFEVSCAVGAGAEAEKISTSGLGASRRIAEQDAAMKAYAVIVAGKSATKRGAKTAALSAPPPEPPFKPPSKPPFKLSTTPTTAKSSRPTKAKSRG